MGGLAAALSRCQQDVERLTRDSDIQFKRIAALQAEVDHLRAKR